MPELITLVQLRGVPLTRLPHFPEDLQPALAQTTKCAGVALTLSAFLPVVSIRPRTFGPGQVGPEMNRIPQALVVCASKTRLVDLPALVADRSILLAFVIAWLLHKASPWAKHIVRHVSAADLR